MVNPLLRQRRTAFLPISMVTALILALAAPVAAVTPTEERAPSGARGQTALEASALAKAASTGEPAEILSQRTETSQAFANPDGSFTQETFALPQWVRKNNKLVDIDPTLAPTADGTLVAKATEVGIAFSGGGSGPLVTITRDGRSMSWSWPTPLPRPEIEGNTATYPEVLEGVDLKMRAGESGFGQLLVVKTIEAAANPALESLEFKLAVDGVTVSADEHGNMRAINPAGQEIFTAPTPRMWDSSSATTGSAALHASDPAAQEPRGDEFEPGNGALETSMPLKVDADSLTLAPDQSLLTGKETTYPVYLDPSVSGSREAWTIIYKKYPDGTFYNGAGWINSDGSKGTSTARVGYENQTNGTARSFFRMDSNNLWNTDKVISASTFRIKNSWSWSCTSRPVETWLTGSISSSTSWNKPPSWTRQLDSVNDSKGYDSSCPAGNLAFDVTSAAKDAVSKHWNNITLGMRVPLTSETDVYGWKKFDAKSAVLSTTYNTRPNAPTALDTIPSTKNAKDCGTAAPYGLIGNTDIYLTAKMADRDGGTVKAKFNLWPTGHHPNDDPSGVIVINKTVSVTSGTVAKLKVTKAELTPHLSRANGNFSWKVQAQDSALSSDWTPPAGAAGCRFVFDPTRPSSPPGVTSQQFPDGSDGWPGVTGSVRTEGTFTLTSGGVADVTKYEYWTDWDATRRTATPNANGGSVSVKLTPTVTGPNRLYAKSYDKAGNSSDTEPYLFYANGPKTPDKPGDINGDGNADLWGVDKDGSLRRFYGAGDGTLTEAQLTASDFTWNSVLITHRGDWNDDAYEDLIALRHDAALSADRLWMHPNNGYGFACTDCADGSGRAELTVYDPANDHWQGASQILAIGDVDGPLDTDGDGTTDAPGYPDLLVKNGNQLWLYYGAPDYRLDSYRDPVLLAAGDGMSEGSNTLDKITLAAPGDFNGDDQVDLVARFDTAGGLFLYDSINPDGPNGPDQVNPSHRIVLADYWTTTNVPLFTAPPDANNNGKFDLWGTTPGTGRLRFFSDYTPSGYGPTSTASVAFTDYQAIS
ncbi:VCBS repeat-containing protein [Streptomyces sp. NBC_01005]|uniref:VCBS repeat-containing protein n=1 Tax=unclassified Streptomyces TaxID=2593676 RepID=UPI002E33B2F8|nr:VCBS repeat-containing protein [Streptomyces sp. NBC_01362]WSW08016.1 VCBS repeat-containing protein [Streptomyces sp. NBC_01005]WTC97526.1 VCBS repeat-containing protein [Streptomyces sp. NBC_01650]